MAQTCFPSGKDHKDWLTGVSIYRAFFFLSKKQQILIVSLRPIFVPGG